MNFRIKLWLFAGILAVVSFNAPGQRASLDQIKSAYLIRFFDYITWDNEQDFDEYRIGVVGQDEELYRELRDAATSLKVKNKSITVTRSDDLHELPGFQLLFITRNSVIPLQDIAVATQRTNTLIVTDGSDDKRDFMINLFQRPDNTVGFEVNRTNIVFERLTMDPDILLLGGTELDVAELFKENEYEMTRMKEKLAASEKDLASLQDELTKQQGKLTSQAQVITRQNKDISSREKTLSAIQEQLSQAGDQLEESRKKFTESEQMLADRLNDLQERENWISSLSSSINENTALLERQKQEISEQSKILEVQKSSLQQQGSTIQEQRIWLLVAGIALAVLILLTGIILYFNNERKKVNASLKAAKETAENASRDLELSERNFRSMVETIPGTVYQCLFDEHWTMKYLSDDIESLCGFPASDFLENNVRSFADIIHPDDKVHFREVINTAITNRESYTHEYRVLHADGSIRWVYEKGMGIFDSEGDLEVLDGTLLDITDRKQVEMELASREEQFRILLEATPDGIVIVDDDGKIVMVNAQVQKLFQYESGELVGNPIEVLVPEQSRNVHLSYRQSYTMRPVVRDMGAGLELYGLRKDGSRFATEINLSPIETPKGLWIISSIRDVTERKKAEDELRQSEQRLALAMSAGLFTPWIYDIRTNRIRSYTFFEQILGFGPGEKKDNLRTWMSSMHPEDIKTVRDAIQGYIEIGRGELRFQYRAYRSNGQERWVEAVGTVTEWEETGAPLIITGMQHDITEKKQAELLIEEKIQELEEFNRLAVGRELRMIELKEQINELLARLGEEEENEIVQ